MKRDSYVYKALTLDQWEVFQKTQVFTGSPVDVADGYIHMSCVSELKATLDKWYADHAKVVLLQVDATKFAEDLKYEVSRGGVEFPHLFNDLPMSVIGQVWVVSSNAGVYTLPTNLKAN